MEKSTEQKDLKAENEQLHQEVARLRQEVVQLRDEVEHLHSEMLRLIGRNLDLSDQLESNVEFRRRASVAKELLDGNIERQRNADLQDDAQLMALLELRVEQQPQHLSSDFGAADLARLIGVSQERLARLFRKNTIYRTAEAYLDNLRVLTALRLLREKPQYNIAAIAEEAGFGNVRTLQRRIHEVLGMTPVEYRAMLTRDL